MSRYIPQHLFDGLVVYRLMADAAGKDDLFDDLARQYRDAYPDEDPATLAADVSAATEEGRYIVKVVMDAPGSTYRKEIDVLQDLLEIVKNDAVRDKPLWRRMIENYFFNMQPTPITDRVEKARAHLIGAEKALLARVRKSP